jgi:hypothetical protein
MERMVKECVKVRNGNKDKKRVKEKNNGDGK